MVEEVDHLEAVEAVAEAVEDKSPFETLSIYALIIQNQQTYIQNASLWDVFFSKKLYKKCIIIKKSKFL